jgi:hypothetical protein
MSPAQETANATLIKVLTGARHMIANYAGEDERAGQSEDAAYARQRLVEIDAALEAARVAS